METIRENAGAIVLRQEMYEMAYREETNLSGWLEKQDPSSKYGDGMDAFERQLMLAGIKTRSVPHEGKWSSQVQDFKDSDRNAWLLFPEWCARVYRAAAMAGFKRFYQSNQPLSDVLSPPFLASQIRQKQIAPAIPLAEMVAITTPIDGDTYKGFYLTDSETNRTLVRVGEGAEFPTVTLTGADRTVNIKKYGRRLLASYETIRRMRLDRLALHLQLMAVQVEVDKVSTAIDILINGDGNTGSTPTNSNLTAVDGDATAGTLTAKGYMAWRMLFATPYINTTILAPAAMALQIMLLNLGSANVPMYEQAAAVGLGGIRLINNGLTSTPGLGWTSDVTANYLLGFDNRFTLEMVYEMASDIVETDKIIRQQLEEVVFSETLGFFVMDSNGLRTMDVNA